MAASTSQRCSSFEESFCTGRDCNKPSHRNRLALRDNLFCGAASPAQEQSITAIDFDRSAEDHLTILYTLECGCIWERREYANGVLADYKAICASDAASTRQQE